MSRTPGHEPATSGGKSSDAKSSKASRPAGKNSASGKRQREEARAKAAAMRAAAERKDKQRRQLFVLGTVVVVLILVTVIAVAVAQGNKQVEAQNKETQAQQQAAVDKASKVPASVFDAAGAPAQPSRAISAIKDGKPTIKNGKPVIYYVGSESCPYCAMQRWAMVAALSRFGTFQGLTPTFSADNEGKVPSMTFHGSKYTSDLIAFEAYEESDRNGNRLDKVPDDVTTLMKTYNAPPYSAGGGIPWTWYGIWQDSGTSVGPVSDFINASTGQTVVTHQQIADGMLAGTPGAGLDAVKSANVITAQVCQLTGEKPAAVCTSSAVVAAKKQLPTKPPTG